MKKNQHYMFSLVVFSVLFFFTMLASADSSYAEDRAKIVDLMGRYLFAMDWRNSENYAATFAEDGILDYAGGKLQGRTAIAQMISDMRDNDRRRDMDGGEMDHRPRTRHNITNTVIEIDGNTAKAWSYWTAIDNSGKDRRIAKISSFGHYEDELIKIDGEWYFTKRVIFNEALTRRKADDESPVPAR